MESLPRVCKAPAQSQVLAQREGERRKVGGREGRGDRQRDRQRGEKRGRQTDTEKDRDRFTILA